eukprot:5372743-Amphidinium_carterae.1
MVACHENKIARMPLQALCRLMALGICCCRSPLERKALGADIDRQAACKSHLVLIAVGVRDCLLLTKKDQVDQGRCQVSGSQPNFSKIASLQSPSAQDSRL